MIKEPKITDKKCDELSTKTVQLINKRAFDGNKLAMKDGRSYIDTVYSFTDKIYIDMAKELTGNVLIYGLGFGATILRACENPEVRSVTVIEYRQEVVDLFYKLQGKEFQGFIKLKIVVKKALDYKKTGFDNVFIDLFHPPCDRKEYDESMAILEKRHNKANVHSLNLFDYA